MNRAHFNRKGHHLKTGLMGGKARQMNGWRMEMHDLWAFLHLI
jgi:nitrogen fixation protein